MRIREEIDSLFVGDKEDTTTPVRHMRLKVILFGAISIVESFLLVSIFYHGASLRELRELRYTDSDFGTVFGFAHVVAVIFIFLCLWLYSAIKKKISHPNP